jgi:hypothetical protein
MKQRLAPAWRAQPNGANAVGNDQSRLNHTMQIQCKSTLHQLIKNTVFRSYYSQHIRNNNLY